MKTIHPRRRPLAASCARILAGCFAGALLGAPLAGAEDWRDLAEQNRRLQEQVWAQQQTIEALSARMAEIAKAGERLEREVRGFADRAEPAPAASSRAAAEGRTVRIAGEAGLAYFRTGPAGQFPKGEFRAEDARVSFEAPIGKRAYVFGELKLLTREARTEDFQLGEIYVDFEDVSAAWGMPGLLSVRAGRMDIPFGEEYLARTPSANPLVSHSLADIWGVDEGVELYGRAGPVSYVAAVQNGGVSRLRDFNADKSITGRVGWDPAPWLHLGASAMRTGELATANDRLSEVWFADGVFRGLQPAARAGTFRATLGQADASVRWKGGRLGASLGRARYADNDRLADNSRRFRFGQVELVQDLAGDFYGAVRHSEIRVGQGYPLTGWGDRAIYLLGSTFTTSLRRTSLGLGYRFAPPLVLKLEYARETRATTARALREGQDFLGTELGVKF